MKFCAADADKVRTNAIRRCNPFLGVLQVIELGDDRVRAARVKCRLQRAIQIGG